MKKQPARKKQNSADDHAFRLSRIYAEGWNAGKRLSLIESEERGSSGETPNPYSTEPQHSRWAEGYAAATGKKKP